MNKLNSVLQIGSHIGNTPNDPIYNLIDESTRLILVEPVPYLFEQLKQNYGKKNVKSIDFINKAVSKEKGMIELYVPSQNNDFSRFPLWASQLASVNPNHISGHLKDLITEKINVETTTINDIINDYNITDLDLLHTDTEGHDYDILMAYDFSIKPKYIMFEYKHLDGCFTCEGPRLQTLLNKLQNLNYQVINQNVEDFTLKLND